PEPAAIFSLFIELKHKFDVVIIDAPAGIGEGFSLSILGADVAVLVTTPDYVALRDADHINNLLRERGIKNRAYVVNKADKTFLGADSLPSVENIISMMHIDLLGIIQSDNNIHLSGSRGRPYVMSGASYVKRNFQKIADRIFRF
ncbi:MAG: P-loop NTPase, partial [Clostridiales Family XIII bacterium]|nr:P-loop NTPase [Clostridiales Family XIII bacterium]